MNVSSDEQIRHLDSRSLDLHVKVHADSRTLRKAYLRDSEGSMTWYILGAEQLERGWNSIIKCTPE